MTAPRTIAISILGLVFLLGAADPTPRFLGFSSTGTPKPHRGEKLKALTSCELPVAARDGVDSPVPSPPPATLLRAPFAASVPAPAVTPAVAPSCGNGTGPPLRC